MHKRVISLDARGSILGTQGDGFTSELGGIMEVALFLCLPLLLGLWCGLGLVHNYVVLVLGNEGGGPITCKVVIQWSRLKSSYEFHFEVLSNFSLSIEGLVQIQDVNPKT